MNMKIFTIRLIIISALVMASMALTPSTALQASSKKFAGDFWVGL